MLSSCLLSKMDAKLYNININWTAISHTALLCLSYYLTIHRDYFCESNYRTCLLWWCSGVFTLRHNRVFDHISRKFRASKCLTDLPAIQCDVIHAVHHAGKMSSGQKWRDGEENTEHWWRNKHKHAGFYNSYVDTSPAYTKPLRCARERIKPRGITRYSKLS